MSWLLSRLRTGLRRSFGFWLAAVTLYALVRGYLSDVRAAVAPAWQAALVALLAVTLVGKVFSRLRQTHFAGWRAVTDATLTGTDAATTGVAEERQVYPRTAFSDFELGLLLLAACYTILIMSGGTRSSAYPLLYVLLAYLVSFNRWLVAVSLVAVTLGVELGLYHFGPALPPAEARRLLSTHAAFIFFFASVNLLFLGAEILRLRRAHAQRLRGALDAVRSEARDFRLISSALGPESRQRSRHEEELQLNLAAVETIHQALYYTLELLKKSLDLHTCVLLWLDESGETMKIKELVTDAPNVKEVEIRAQAGVVGNVVKRRLLINLNLKDPRAIPYYSAERPGSSTPKVRSFIGVPVEENGHLRGVLCADRTCDRPFTPAEEGLLQGAAQQIVRTIQSERIFTAVERSKYEQERFYRASESLNSALTLEETYEVSFRAARHIVEYDFAAVALFDKETGKHTICRVAGPDGKMSAEIADQKRAMEGLEFTDNAGLASMVVKNKHYLPASGAAPSEAAVVYTRKVKLTGMESLLVLPLVVKDEAVGTFTLACHRPAAFSKQTRDMLGVIVNQVAVSLENAKMYARMQQMATTDGLTGLMNHRTFQGRFDEMLGRAGRHGKPCSLILPDIDHFKKINDTYGHPMGDQVLRRVAKVLADGARKIDIVARLGGEEFALVLEETDAAGARKVAERIRLEVAALQFSSEKGPFRLTLSMGIASYPEHAREKQVLFDRADKSLYHAKHAGRNQVVTYGELLEAQRTR
jgi:diguanylate cyclase (GGDEF)-like protein